MDIKAGNVPGQAGNVTIGRYAWWAADEGVKASVALPDRGEAVTYAPWDTAVQRHRIRQQISSGPSYCRAAADTQYGFDPFDTANLTNLWTCDLRRAAGQPQAGDGVGQALCRRFLQSHYHDVTAVAYGVVANTRNDAYRGLLQDLSLAPSALGDAFVAYANYPAYMETPGSTTGGAPTAVPAIANADSARRRYKIMVPATKPSATGACPRSRSA